MKDERGRESKGVEGSPPMNGDAIPALLIRASRVGNLEREAERRDWTEDSEETSHAWNKAFLVMDGWEEVDCGEVVGRSEERIDLRVSREAASESAKVTL